MNPRAFLGILGAALLVFLVFSFANSDVNREILAQELVFHVPEPPGTPYVLSVGESLFAAFLAGAVAIGIAWAVRGMRVTVLKARERKTARGRLVVESSYQQGLEAALRGETAQALEKYRTVLESDGEHRGALMGAADAHRALGQFSEALDLRERFLTLEPGDPRGLAELAEDHHGRGDHAQATSALQRLLDSRQKDKAVSLAAAARLTQLSLDSGDIAKAAEAHAQWAKLSRAAITGDATNDSQQPADLVQAAMATRRAAQEARDGAPGPAVSELRKLVKRFPDLSPAWLALGQALLLDGQESKALEVWIDGYERTREGSLLVAAEEHFRRSGDEENAVERVNLALSTFQSFVACSGDRPQAVAFLGKLQTRLEMLDAAAASFDSVRESFPDNPTFTYYAARIAEKQGHHEKAASWYRGIVKSLDVLRLRYRCTHCSIEAPEYGDRCLSCRRWGTVSLDIGLHPLREPLPAAHPVYAVPGEEQDLADERSAGDDDERRQEDVLG